MKKPFKFFRIYNKLFVLVITLVLCIRLRVICISVTPHVNRPDYPDEGNPPPDDYSDGDGREEFDEVEGKFSKTMRDRDEHRVRNFVSEHEIPKEVPVKLKILGDLATPAPISDINLGFVPKQTYVQVRRYDTEVHLPRSAALAEAKTDEEILNAPRLREVVSQKKTQEVYEEQGYEDAAYDHGGYKKAGEHHESKYVPPREQKTDNKRIMDQSTEQAEIVNVGRYSTTHSSHTEPEMTTEKHSTNQTRSNKQRPKGGRGSWSRHKQTTKAKNTKSPHNEVENKRTSNKKPSPPGRRRQTKNNKTTTGDENKLMEESKFHTTRKLITELDIEPTTYHPMPLIKITKAFEAKKPESKPFIPPRIGNDGYKFEYPFKNFDDFNEVRSSVKHPPAKMEQQKGYFHFSPGRPKELIKYGESRDVNQVYVSPVMALKPKLKPVAKFTGKIKVFPYELINSGKAPFEKKGGKTKGAKFSFPYEIVKGATVGPTKSSATESGHFRIVATEATRESQKSIFGAPDNSPWIPIVPKEVYKIQGYDRTGRPSLEIRVRENEDSAEINVKKLQNFSPIRVFEGTGARPKTVSTSYSIQHVYAPVERRPFPKKSKGTSYQVDHPDGAESIRKFSTFGGTSLAQVPSAEPDSLIQSTISRPSTGVSFLRTVSKSSPLPYDIITAHSSDIRTAFTENHPSSGNSELGSRSPPIYSTTIDWMDASLESESNSTTKPSNEVPEKDIETMSSNRYAIFQRVNHTPPMVSTTMSLDEINDEFEKLYLNERDKFLFRHPHLSRETSRFIKAHPENTTQRNNANATTLKRDIIFSNVRNGSVTHLTKVSKRNDIYQKPILVYPQDFASSAKYVEKLTLAHFTMPENVAYSPVPLNYHNRMTTLTSHLNADASRTKRQADQDDAKYDDDDHDSVDEDDENEELVNVFLGGTTTEFSVNVKKYPFYKTIAPDGISKYSVLRYVSNPVEIPKKHVGQMTFYASKDRIRCAEPTPPQNIVPPREDGEWAFHPKPNLPRINLGDKITCLKMKFFGSDPLDNPFFKEEYVGYPEIVDVKKINHRARSSEQSVAQTEDVEDVDDDGDDFEMLPKSFFRSLKQKRGKRVKKSQVARLERAVIESGEAYIKSPTRRWIESLAEPGYSSKLYKRSATEQTQSRKSNEEGKRVQKVIVGGFINRERDATASAKGKKEKVHTDIRGNTIAHTDRTTTHTDRTRFYIPYSSTMPTDTTKAEKLSTEAAIVTTTERKEASVRSSAPYLLIGSLRPTITDMEAVKNFNDDFGQILDMPPTTQLESEEEVDEDNDDIEGEKDEDDPPYTSIVFQKTSELRTQDTTGKQQRDEGKFLDNTTYVFSPSEIVPTTSSKTKKAVYVDALSSLRSQQHSANGSSDDSFEGTSYKYQYQEPTWRVINQSALIPAMVERKTSPEIDSLLYVIHPKTGEGKWMKLLKVEEVTDGGESSDGKVDSLSSGNDRRVNAITPPPNFLSLHDPNNDHSTGYKKSSSPPCREEEKIIKKPLSSDYDVYHISGLLKQVAPMKASEVEINNLQTTEEQQTEDDEEDEEEEGEDDDNEANSSYFDLDDDLYATTKFPEPHERLYYYVHDNRKEE